MIGSLRVVDPRPSRFFAKRFSRGPFPICAVFSSLSRSVNDKHWNTIEDSCD